MFCGYLWFRGTQFEKHWCSYVGYINFNTNLLHNIFLLFPLLHVSAMNYGHLQEATSLFDFHSIRGRLYIYIYIYIYMDIYPHMYMCVYINMYIRTYTCVCQSFIILQF
jgi:hypothetical protein